MRKREFTDSEALLAACIFESAKILKAAMERHDMTPELATHFLPLAKALKIAQVTLTDGVPAAQEHMAGGPKAVLA